MDLSTRAALGILDELRRELPPAGPVMLSAAYLAAVEQVEALDSNRSGRDKTWVEAAQRRFRKHFRNARPAR